MKPIYLITIFCLIAFCSYSQNSKLALKPAANLPLQNVEISCGECRFGLKGKSCDLAIRINDSVYFVDGANIDSFGDAHANEGFCNAIRKAIVQGDIINNRFKASYIKVLDVIDQKN